MFEGEAPARMRYGAGTDRQTVVGLFEDTIDAERALVTLRKAHRPPEQVSLLVRNRAADDGAADRTGAVSRAMVAMALDAVGNWLHGLAALMVPERGNFLVAGPLGATLAGIGGHHRPAQPDTQPAESDERAEAYQLTAEFSPDALLNALTEFGFRDEEATYLEHRLTADATVVALTTGDTDELEAARHVFADHDAVYIAVAHTDVQIVEEAEDLLAAVPAGHGGDVLVVDAVTPLRKLCEGETEPTATLCGAPVVDRNGEEAGTVAEVLADAHGHAAPADQPAVVRYVVIAFGGVLGLGRHQVAVPADQVALDARPFRLAVARDVLHHAPTYDEDSPFSRREERAIFAYFNSRPYWGEG